MAAGYQNSTEELGVITRQQAVIFLLSPVRVQRNYYSVLNFKNQQIVMVSW